MENDSLSLVLPVRNAERTLVQRVGRLLDLLPDLTSRFEIVVVDDGSSDHTAEVAGELARQYPQLRLIRHDRPRGPAAATKTGLRSASGRRCSCRKTGAAQPREPPAAVVPAARSRPRHGPRPAAAAPFSIPELLDRLSAWGQKLRDLAKETAAGGVQMIRRDGAIAEPALRKRRNCI